MTQLRASRDPLYDEDEFSGGFLAGVGELIAAYPSIAGGTAAFAVIFGFVASNALWYQPGKHPAPIMQTRPAVTETQSLASTEAANDVVAGQIGTAPQREVSSYKIEREDNPPTASIPVPTARPTQTASISPAPVDTAPKTAREMPAADPVLAQIQKLLKYKGFYGGEVDGLIGPMSMNAIRNWQRRAGLEMDGVPSEAVLQSLRIGGRPEPLVSRQPEPAVTEPAAPAPRPAPVIEAVAPTPAPQQVAAAAPAGGDDLVRRIQIGLSNIAYADVAVDGFAGGQTKAAIAAFEKHYRLPVTGEANEAVLNKLLEIGAL